MKLLYILLEIFAVKVKEIDAGVSTDRTDHTTNILMMMLNTKVTYKTMKLHISNTLDEIRCCEVPDGHPKDSQLTAI